LPKLGIIVTDNSIPESQRHDICGWIQQNDPSSLHNIARELIEEGTCSWVVRLPEWDQWVNLQSRCLWIHGIPGCGKTVLASHLIEETRRICDETANSSYVSIYYYCHHSRNMDESMPFLRWVVSQLCREAERVPKRLHDMHKRRRDPTRTELLACLEEAVGWFDTVFVIVDALDESQAPWVTLLSLLQTLVTEARFQNIQLLATSREYLAIQQTMTAISQPVSMAHPHFEKDIAIAVEKSIQSTPRFQAWPADIRDQVTDTLSREANGMFRWAICQLDILRYAANVDQITDALSSLPPTLDDTYQRIFSSVARQDWPLLRHCLQMIRFHDWLCASWASTGLSPSLILEAYSARRGGANQFYSVETLKEICGCLVNFASFEGGDFATFAHYTVREFVESDRVLTGPAAYFALHESNKEVAGFMFHHALTVSSGGPLPRPTRLGTNWFYDTDEIYWLSQSNVEKYCIFSSSGALYDYEEFIATDEDLSKLAYQFLDPVSPGFNTRSHIMRDLLGENTIMFRDSGGRGERFWDMHWNQPPGTPEVGILTLLLWCSFFKLGANFRRHIRTQSLNNPQLSLKILDQSRRLPIRLETEFRGSITELFLKYIPTPQSVIFSTSKVTAINAILQDFGLGLIPSQNFIE